MVQKVVSRETFNYRKVTDLPVKEDINGDQGAADRGASPVSVPEDTVIARGLIMILCFYIITYFLLSLCFHPFTVINVNLHVLGQLCFL